MGQALAMNMAQGGATHLVLTSRRGVTNGAQRRLLLQLESMGVLVGVSACVSPSLTESAQRLHTAIWVASPALWR